MVESQADIKAGRVDDFDAYLEKIGRMIDEAQAAQKTQTAGS